MARQRCAVAEQPQGPPLRLLRLCQGSELADLGGTSAVHGGSLDVGWQTAGTAEWVGASADLSSAWGAALGATSAADGREADRRRMTGQVGERGHALRAGGEWCRPRHASRGAHLHRPKLGQRARGGGPARGRTGTPTPCVHSGEAARRWASTTLWCGANIWLFRLEEMGGRRIDAKCERMSPPIAPRPPDLRPAIGYEASAVPLLIAPPFAPPAPEPCALQ